MEKTCLENGKYFKDVPQCLPNENFLLIPNRKISYLEFMWKNYFLRKNF